MARKRWGRRPSRSTGRQLALSALAGALLAAGIILLVHSRLRPALAQLAGAQVNNLVVGLVSEAVREDLASNTLEYGDLISLEKDHTGQITALNSNMASAEVLRGHIVERLLEQLDGLTAQELLIPCGSLTGSALLSGRGPAFPVRILSAGVLSADFDNQFTSAGINQTRYQVVLKVHVTVELLLPGGPEETEVATQVVAAETILLGQVPEHYTYFSQFDTAKDAADSYFDYGTN